LPWEYPLWQKEHYIARFLKRLKTETPGKTYSLDALSEVHNFVQNLITKRMRQLLQLDRAAAGAANLVVIFCDY